MSIKKMVNRFYELMVISHKLVEPDILSCTLLPNSNTLIVFFIKDKKLIVKIGTNIGFDSVSSVNSVIMNGDTMPDNIANAMYLAYGSSTLPDILK